MTGSGLLALVAWVRLLRKLTGAFELLGLRPRL